MRITIAKEQLINGLQAVQNVVSTRTTLPILSNVLLEAEDNRLALTATDLDVTIACSVDAEVGKAGAITLPVKKLFGIVRELATPELEMEVDEKSICSIQAGASFFKMHGLAAEEYPPIPRFEEQRKVKLPQEKMKTMLKRTAYAVSTEETRYVLNGIFFTFRDDKLKMVATDGRRLALADEEVELASEEPVEFIVPTKAINELSRLLADKGEVEIENNKNQAAFTLSEDGGFSVLIITKLVDGNYPNYKQVIPAQCNERVTLVREEFLHALRRAEIMTSDKANSVKFAFTSNNLTITANTPEVGEAVESLAINYSGPDLSVAFNPVYMMDPLKVVEEEEVFLELTDELSPGVLKINGPFLYVIMPMRMS